MTSRVSSKEAAALVNLLLSTPQTEHAERWPSLLTILTRWAAQGSGLISQGSAPARPWERKQQQGPQQQHTNSSAQQQQQLLLQQASEAVVLALSHAAQAAYTDPSGDAAVAVSKLFVPAVLFLSAALAAAEAPLAQQLQPSVVAAACEAAAALAAAPADLLAAAGSQQAVGLPAVLSSCTALLITCKGDSTQTAWLISSLLYSLHTAIPNIIQHTLQQQQQQQQQQQFSATSIHASLAAGSSSSPCFGSWLQQQLEQTVVSSTLGLLPQLYNLGHGFGISCCRDAAAGANSMNLPSSSSGGGGGSSGSGSVTGGLPALHAVAVALVAACNMGDDALLVGLAGAVAAGLCAGVLQGLPPQQPAVPAAAAAAAQHAVGSGFAAMADAAWQDGPNHNQQQQARQQRGIHHRRSSTRRQLQQYVDTLLQAVQAACGRCHNMQQQHTAAAAAAAAHPNPAAQYAAAPVVLAASIGQGLLGQAYGQLWSTCGHLLDQRQQQQQQQQHSFAGMYHTLQYLLGCCCSLSGVWYHAVGCHNAAAANAWLAEQQQQHPAHEVGQLARWLAAAAAAAAAAATQGSQFSSVSQEPLGWELLQLLSALRGSAPQLAGGYSTLQLAAPAAVIAGLDAAAVRQQLDANFAVHVVMLQEVWGPCMPGRQLADITATNSQPVSTLPRSSPAAAGAAGAAAAVSELPSSLSSVQHLRSSADLQAIVVAAALADLASLQFCRVQLPVYVELLQSLVSTLADSSTAAEAFIDAALPCYERLTQPHPAAAAVTASSSSRVGIAAGFGAGVSHEGEEGVVSGALWLQDSVTAAELTFLLPLLPVAVRAAGCNAAEAAGRVLPLLLLLLPHPLPAVSQAAHASYAGLMAVAGEQQQQQRQESAALLITAASDDGTQQQQQQQQQQQEEEQVSLMGVMQQSVPMYLSRALGSLPGCGSLEGLAASYHSLLRNLPPGSVLGLLAVTQLADKTLQLSCAADAATDSAPVSAAAGTATAGLTAAAAAAAAMPGDSSVESAGAVAAAAAQKLFELLVLFLQAGDYQLLPAMLDRVAGCVLAAPPSLQQGWLAQLYAGCVGVGDYCRKPALIAWVDGLRKQLVQQQQKHLLPKRQQVGSKQRPAHGEDVDCEAQL